MTAPPSSAPLLASHFEAAFAREEYLGLQLAVRVRVVASAVIALWIPVENSFPQVFIFEAFAVLFALFGFAPLWLYRAGRYERWMRYVFPLLDAALLTTFVFLPNPFEAELVPRQQYLRFGNELYLFPFIAASAFSYSPMVVLWSGICAALVWSIATLWIVLLPDSAAWVPAALFRAMPRAEQTRVLIDPHRVHYGMWGRQVVLFVLTAAGMAVFVRRARRLVVQQAQAERERANLSRYFSPNLVDELAQTDQPLGPTRQQDVAVLFADIVGFTAMAEGMSPGAVIELLRAFHGRMERLVFDHAGTIDKYIGDGIMATFGTPRTSRTDATNAVRCACAMIDAMRAWNAERGSNGAAPVHVGIGLHYGPVVLGDIGGEARLEYTVLGDTVNVASRLERLTREHHVSLVASDAVVAAARVESPDEAGTLFASFVPGPPETLRGRTQPLAVWMLGA
jgi:adenylate cyclase